MEKHGKVLVAPSILSADFSNLGEAVRRIESSGADWVHLDVMDGRFVPNLTFGPKMVADLRRHSRLVFDTHLMIVHPENFVDAFAAAGSDLITVHFEQNTHLHRLLTEIRSRGKKAGVSIVPSTPVACIEEILPLVDLVLVMTVNPGFGGQELIEQTLTKVSALRESRAAAGHSFLIEVDGGINRTTAGRAVAAGADVLVAGSAFFNSPDPAAEVEYFKGLSAGEGGQEINTVSGMPSRRIRQERKPR